MSYRLLVPFLAVSSLAHAAVNVIPWGQSAGAPVNLYTLSDSQISVQVTNFGARVVAVQAPDRRGAKADVVLGYNDLAAYEADKKTYLGSTPGRYANRVAHGRFTLDGVKYTIPTNDGANALHGGTVGFDRKVWTGKVLSNGVEFTLVSPDGDMGFPGQLTVQVRYTLEGDALAIHYAASTTKPTVLNLTNHTYFNLSGEGSGSILNEVLTLPAADYTPVDKSLIPTGQLAPVAGTPFDFRQPSPIGKRIGEPDAQLQLALGYDHNFVLSQKSESSLHLAAKVADPASGRTLTVSTTEPGVQFYSGNHLDGATTGRSGKAYAKHAGFCLETQHFPNSPNQPNFPSTVLQPGQEFHSETVFTFGVEHGS
ncbi:MAG: aldose epimerase family protein [Janthinobacterium lividum]